jgi:hypothetical protein
MAMEMEGIASIALLPSGSISGHFIPHTNATRCFAIYGTQLPCERECSRGEDYRLIKLTIFDYFSKREQDVIVECRGQDAARFQNADHVHGWEEDVICMVEKSKEKHNKLFVSFECETLKADKQAKDHIHRYLPHLIGHEAVVNIGTMKIRGLNFDSDDHQTNKTSTLKSKDTDAELFITGSASSCQPENSLKCGLSHCPAESSSTYDQKFLELLGNNNQEASNPDEAVIRQLLAEELQADGNSANIPENKWQHSSSGWRIKKKVLHCTEE